jgi:hypothetical protein
LKIKADAGDLMTEADRTDYSLQTVNEVVDVPGMDGEWQKRCKKWLGKVCGDGDDHPATVVDPTLVHSSENVNAMTESHHSMVREMAGFGYPKTKENSGIFGAVMDVANVVSDGIHDVASAVGAGSESHRKLGADWSEPAHKGEFFIAPYAQYQSLVAHSKEHGVDGDNDHSKLQPMFRTYRGTGWDGGMGLFRDIDRLRLINSILARHLNLRAFADEYRYASSNG